MNQNELKHYGVLGMKWGVRRYQNDNGSLTQEGKKRLRDYKEKEAIKSNNKYDRDIRRYSDASKKYKDVDKDKYKTYTKRVKELESLKKLENTKIKHLTYDGMMKEKIEMGRYTARIALGAIGGAAIGGIIGVAFAPSYRPDSKKTELRLKNG